MLLLRYEVWRRFIHIDYDFFGPLLTGTPQQSDWNTRRCPPRSLVKGQIWPKPQYHTVLKVLVVTLQSLPVFRIRDILVRIRIRGSVPLTNGSSSGSCSFRQVPSKRHQKLTRGPKSYKRSKILLSGTLLSTMQALRYKRNVELAQSSLSIFLSLACELQKMLTCSQVQ